MSKVQWRVAIVLAVGVLTTPLFAEPAASRFGQAMKAAMNRMMVQMEVKPSADVDRDFVAMMVPHHQGAIDMAVAQLRFGQNEHLKRIAQEIIVEQQQEIAAMRMAIGEAPPRSAPVPTRPADEAHTMHMEP
jgi:uncharacterized protein (DUF305 family)